MLLALVCAARAAIVFGGAWAPVGTGALAWDDADRWSDTLAGEFDGLLRPPLTAHGGWIGSKDAVLAGFALVRFADAQFASSSTYTGVGSTRFSADYRRYVWAREPGRVDFYGDGGVYGILPNAKQTNDSFTEEEQNSADESSASLRARIGGVGAQLGIGADYLFADAAGRPAVGLGVRYLARLYRGQAATEDGYDVSTVLVSEAAVTLEFQR
jgi:hypothetical protein